jgi:hypothetical protein
MSDLRHLVMLRQAAKVMEDAAIAERRALDAQIAQALGTGEARTSSRNVDGYQVTVTYGVARKVDGAALQAQWDRLPPAVLNCFDVKFDVRARSMAGLTAAEASIAAKYITEKPATPAVRVSAPQSD